uniref:Uncharacterized protein n=1 Tax=Glossina palpalis gambiensis TaxID=67801 RepID=A0A1B0BCL4_9MUSC
MKLLALIMQAINSFNCAEGQQGFKDRNGKLEFKKLFESLNNQLFHRCWIKSAIVYLADWASCLANLDVYSRQRPIGAGNPDKLNKFTFFRFGYAVVRKKLLGAQRHQHNVFLRSSPPRLLAILSILQRISLLLLVVVTQLIIVIKF